MFRLTRVVRAAINDPSGQARSEAPAPGSNTYAGWPPFAGLARHYAFEIACEGRLHPQYSYLIDIKDVDRAVRATLIPAFEHAVRDGVPDDGRRLLADSAQRLAERLHGLLRHARWHASPFLSLEVDMNDPSTVLLREKFDFAASHRLHVPSMSEADNLRVFGKCAHPSGHGHNYQVEPCIAVKVRPDAAHPFGLPQLEALVDRVILSRFDHKYLNVDTPEFGPRGVVPSVENIAKVCFELLRDAVAREHPDAVVRAVTVWESDRTSSTYPA